MPPEANLHSMSIFNSPRVIVVKGDGCLSLRLGHITINIYGADPFNVDPELVEMTEEQVAAERNREFMKRAGMTDEAPSVE